MESEVASGTLGEATSSGVQGLASAAIQAAFAEEKEAKDSRIAQLEQELQAARDEQELLSPLLSSLSLPSVLQFHSLLPPFPPLLYPFARPLLSSLFSSLVSLFSCIVSLVSSLVSLLS